MTIDATTNLTTETAAVQPIPSSKLELPAHVQLPVQSLPASAWIPGHEVPSHDEIAREAYALYEARGRENGWDVEDWLAAEEMLRHRNRH